VKTNRSQSRSHEKESAGTGAMYMKNRAPESELCHFYDGSAALTYATLKIMAVKIIIAIF